MIIQLSAVSLSSCSKMIIDRGRVFSSLLIDPGPSGQGACKAIRGYQRLEPIDHVSFQTNLALYLLRWLGLARKRKTTLTGVLTYENGLTTKT